MPVIRPYRPDDLDAVREICVLTGYAGGDARPYSRDPDLLPDIFAVPYVVAEPELAFVVDNGERAVGYILGTADTAAFTRWFRTTWLPPLVNRYPPPAGEPRNWAETMASLLHNPERMLVPELADYPAHLHIDLLPGYQRQGLGRDLMFTFLRALHERGVPRVHLGVAAENTAAQAFYERCGFHRIEVPSEPSAIYLGRGTAPS